MPDSFFVDVPEPIQFAGRDSTQSTDRTDLFHAHIGGMDTVAHALIVATAPIDDGALDDIVDERYSGWSGQLTDSNQD